MDNFEILVTALRQHINADMDQWELWKMRDAIGNIVYITISYQLDDGYVADAFDDLDFIGDDFE